MKIIEALKEMPLLEKRINSNVEQIAQYAAGNDIGNGGFVFETAERQRQEVAGLLQSTQDLVDRRAALRRKLYITNTQVMVTIEGQTKTITEWIEYREKGAQLLINAYSALNDNRALAQIRTIQYNPEAGIKTVRFYNESDKNAKIQEITKIKDQIDAKLEIINATTDLVE